MTIWWGTSEVPIRKMCDFHAKGEVARVRWVRGLCRIGIGKVMERYNFVRLGVAERGQDESSFYGDIRTTITEQR